MMSTSIAALVLASCVAVVILSWLLKYVKWVWLEPKKLERLLRDQGLKGSPYRLLVGDLGDYGRLLREVQSKPMALTNDIAPRIAPLLVRTLESYGKMSFMWYGPTPRVIIMDPELMKEILFTKIGDFAKPKNNPAVALLVTGLVKHEGEKWEKHRKIINPAFHQEKLKLMFPAFSTSGAELINRWKKLVDSSGGPCELDVWLDLQNFTGDVISRTAFGSNYEEGKRIFPLQSEQAKNVIELMNAVPIPGLRFLPTKRNLRMREIDREVRKILTSIINKKLQALRLGEARGDDLLGILLESNIKLSQENNSKNLAMTIEEVIEECKLFYFAGQESTSVLLTWTIILLSVNPNWQSRARQEVFQVFGDANPDLNGLNRLKIITMILNEVLRLYPPADILIRRTYKEMKLGEVTFPPEVQFALSIFHIHRDHEIWGEDAGEFNPERFSEGIAKATRDRVAFFPFGWGPRICIGERFALMEAKLTLAMMLQNFSFELSPTYAHAPQTIISLQPQYGAQVILRKL